MARFRLARTAQSDLARIFSTSAGRWGPRAAHRYAALLAAAMREIAADPKGPTSRDRAELTPDIRGFHIRHARDKQASSNVREPAHVLYYRAAGPGSVEIVRVLHERMEPSRHVGTRRRSKRRT
jgi:toxin ParE1/3/4